MHPFSGGRASLFALFRSHVVRASDRFLSLQGGVGWAALEEVDQR
ncbi:Hypothetical protein Cp262_1340 [Corynebacterium pseudotuberculosis]|nr:hypothetical protein [Corynebacterium pseudotuberculosis]AKP09003.1 Hypothetical protein Cp262_1340 [Corynebacterium pseudotuberculosis]